MRIPSTPCSIVRQASEAVPTPASTMTGTESRLLMVRMLNGLRRPSPLPIGEASGITAAAPASSSRSAVIRSSLVYASTAKPSRASDRGRLEQARDVGQQRLAVADDFELDELVEPRFARQPGVAHGLVGGVAARRVGQQEPALRIQVMQDALLLGPVQVHPAHRDGDDLGAGRADGGDHFLVAPVLAGTDHQPRAELAARNHER